MNSFSVNLRRAAVAVCLAGGVSAQAWDVQLAMDQLENNFYVDSLSGGGSYTWTTQQEGLRSGFGLGSVPNNEEFQIWENGTWTTDSLDEFVSTPGGLASADAAIEHYDGLTDEAWDYAQASVYGNLLPNEALSAGFFYDFELVVGGFTTLSITLSTDTTIYMLSELGDEGNAFGSVRLYNRDLDLDEEGGINDPYAIDNAFLSSPSIGGEVSRGMGFSYEFVNNDFEAQTYNLRLMGQVSVFEAVPEPASLVLLAGGSALMLRRRR